MRMINLRRVAVVAIPVLGLLATMTPPASATTLVLIAFQGTATLGSGISYPCVGTAAPDLNKCPGGTVTPTTTTDVNDIGGNSTGFSFSSSLCRAVGLTTLPSLGVIAGECSITAGGTVTGSCGLSLGQGTYTVNADFTLVGPPPTPGQVTINGSFKFVGLGGTLVLTGDATGGNPSALVGAVEAVPLPTITTDPPSTGNSCLAKSARDFTIAGTVAIAAV